MFIKKIAILFSGNGTNLETILKKVHNKVFNNTKIEVVVTITNNPNALGINKAKNFNVPVVIIENKKFNSREKFDEALVKKINNYEVNLTVLAGFMRILTPVFTENIKAINLHPSLLPLFKGAHAIEESYKSDMKVAGITVHYVNSELDGGKIISQMAFQKDDKTFEEFENTIHELEHILLPETIIQLLCQK